MDPKKSHKAKAVIVVPKADKNKPRKLTPLKRPETPHLENRVRTSMLSSRASVLELSQSLDLSESSESILLEVLDFIPTDLNPRQTEVGLLKFVENTSMLAENGVMTMNDYQAYKKIHKSIMSVAQNENYKRQPKYMVMIASGYRNLIAASASNDEIRAKSEIFYQVLSNVYFSISTDKGNEDFFCSDPSLCDMLIRFTQDPHSKETKQKAINTLRNAAHSPQFRKILSKSQQFGTLKNCFNDSSDRAVKICEYIALLLRFLLNDPPNVQIIANNGFSVPLVQSLMKHQDKSLVEAGFRVLTRLTNIESVRESLIKAFEMPKLFEAMYQWMDKFNEAAIIDRIGYVMNDFVPETKGCDVLLLVDLMPKIPQESQATILQVIANLCVEKESAEMFSYSEELPKLFEGHTFVAEDQSGFNLLCMASNISFYENRWSPKELIDAIPRAIVSKNPLSIIEALRTLCNIALNPNSMLIDSQIFELLCILLRHTDSEIVCFSLQTLTNLIDHAGMRRRFQEADGVDALLEILSSDQLDESLLEAIAKFSMNFSVFSHDEAKRILDAINEFDIDPSLELFAQFKEFLAKLSS